MQWGRSRTDFSQSIQVQLFIMQHCTACRILNRTCQNMPQPGRSQFKSSKSARSAGFFHWSQPCRSIVQCTAHMENELRSKRSQSCNKFAHKIEKQPCLCHQHTKKSCSFEKQQSRPPSFLISFRLFHLLIFFYKSGLHGCCLLHPGLALSVPGLAWVGEEAFLSGGKGSGWAKRCGWWWISRIS